MRYIVRLVLILVLLNGCVTEDYFGKSDRSEIKSFVIPGQRGVSIIDDEQLTIIVIMPETVADLTLTPSEITLSNFARVTPEAGEAQDFSSPVDYVVRAEDGSESVYTVKVGKVGSLALLDNASFEDCYAKSAGFQRFKRPRIEVSH